MKKLSIIVSVMMLFALAAPAFAAEPVIDGQVRVRTAYAEDATGTHGFNGDAEVDVEIDVAQGSDISASFQYNLRPGGAQALGLNTGLSGNTYAPTLDHAFLQFKGPFIPGGQSITTKLGRFGTNLNAFVGNFGTHDALHISGINLGPGAFQFYHNWESATLQTNAFSGNVDIDVVNLNGVVVLVNNAGVAHTDFALETHVTPSDGVDFGVDFAKDGANDAGAWVVHGELGTMDNLNITASTWSTDAAYAPANRSNANREDLVMDRTWTSRPSATGDGWMATGFAVGVETTQGGLPFDVSFKSGTIFSNAPAPYQNESMMIFGVGTTLAETALDLTYTTVANDPAVVDLVAKRGFAGMFVADKVDVTGRVRLQNGVTNFGADAVWKAPNGVNLGLHYANYDRGADWDHAFNNNSAIYEMQIGVPGAADGFAVTAGYDFDF